MQTPNRPRDYRVVKQVEPGSRSARPTHVVSTSARDVMQPPARIPPKNEGLRPPGPQAGAKAIEQKNASALSSADPNDT